jgi:hypothetical protein
MPQPYPNPTGINTTSDIIRYANTVTDNSITILFTVACVIVMFLLLKRKFYRNSDSVAIASLLTLVLSSFLWIAGLLESKFLLAYLMLTIVSVIWSIFDKG